MTRNAYPLFSTKAKRKEWARIVSEVATEVMGVDVRLEPCRLHPGEFAFRLENVETDRGPVRWISIGVDKRGVDVHTAFAMPEYAPAGANRFSGKWNHYLWFQGETNKTGARVTIEHELWRILAEVKPNGAVRQNRPDMSDYWACERDKFTAQCAARDAAKAEAAA